MKAQAMTVQDKTLDTLFQAGLLCDVCQERPWTQQARFHTTVLCAACAEGEPAPEDGA